jgi:transforming growth factor-beta-induced protein
MKNLLNLKVIIALMFASSLLVTSCEKDDDDNTMVEPAQKNIVQLASGNGDFSILVEALQKADLVSALEAEGPYTVFAPTNDAFQALFTDLGVSGLDDLSADALTPILLYHVVSGAAKSTDLSTGYIKSINNSTEDMIGVNMLVDISNGVMINNSTKVINADIMASNGVIHAVDKVLLPQSIVDIALNNDNFSILVEALVKANLVDALKADGPFTVFAPTNDAFTALFADLKVSGISDLSADDLTPILLYHVVNGNVNSTEVATGTVPTLNTSASIDMTVSASGVALNNTSNVVSVDVQGTNGIIHVIDKVLVPVDKRSNFNDQETNTQTKLN